MSKKDIKWLITVLLCSLLISISLIGCGSEETIKTTKKLYGGREFVRIDYGMNDDGFLLVDVKTKVQYIQLSAGESARMITVIDAEGKPILYEGSLEVE